MYTLKSFPCLLIGSAVVAGFFMTSGRCFARANGVDVSHYQGSVNWNSAYNNNGIRFGFAKATEGDYYQDANYGGNMANGKAAGVMMGAYHFARPDLNDGTHEANYFYDYAGGHISNSGLTVMPVLDLEVFSGHVGASGYTDWANQWGDRLKTRLNNDSHTCNWIIYISACNACNVGNSINGRPWIANYNGQDPDTGTPWSVCSSCKWDDTWRFWQYTDSGSVSGIGTCDRDTYNGSASDLSGSSLIVHKYP